MNGRRQSKGGVLASTLVALALLGACEREQNYPTPTAPDPVPDLPPPSNPKFTSIWQVEGTLISSNGAAVCLQEEGVGRRLLGQFLIDKEGTDLTIFTDYAVPDGVAYLGTLNGIYFATDPLTRGPWGNSTSPCSGPSVTSDLSGVIARSTSGEDFELKAFERFTRRLASGEESSTVWAWTGRGPGLPD